MTEKPIIIFGAGGLGRELRSWIANTPGYRFVGFVDDNLPVHSKVDDANVLGGLSSLAGVVAGHPGLNVVIAIGDPRIRMQVGSALSAIEGIKFPVMIHPRAVLDDSLRIKIGAGTIITAGCVLTTGITIGRHVLINLTTTIGHDTVINDYTSIMPGVNLSGSVTLEQAVFLGAGACVLNGIRIGANTRVGAGSVVLKDLPANCTAVGVPAKAINK